MAQVRIDGTVHRLPSSAVTASRHARKVLADVVERIGPLRNRAIFIGARAPHAQTAAERQMLLAECREIGGIIQLTRTELIVRLMDVPRAVAGHSRVLDIEKSLDSLERGLAETRAALGGD